MALLWKDDLLTGVQTIDEQHQELFKRIGQLLEACRQGKGKAEVVSMVDFLVEYVQVHFADEEKLQRDSGYPDYKAHKALHDQWVVEIADLRQQLQQDGPTVSLVLQVNRTLVDWLTQHIRRVDKGLAKHLHNKN